jgi:hypothetical protein
VSTKIYEAYRVRQGVSLWPLLWDIKRQGQEAARGRLAAAYRDILDGPAQVLADWYKAVDAEIAATDTAGHGKMWLAAAILTGERMPAAGPRPAAAIAVTTEQIRQDLEAVGGEVGPIEGLDRGDSELSVLDVDTWACRKYGAQLSKAERNAWNLEVSVSISELDGRFYLIPHCDRASLVRGALDFLGELPDLEHYGYWDNVDKPDEVSETEWAERREAWGQMLDRGPEHLVLSIVSFDGFHEVSPSAMMAPRRP